MTTTNPQQRQFTLFHKFSTEVRPSEMVQRDDRIRLMACSFEEIAESDEEDVQLPERTSPDGRSPFAVAFDSPFAERRRTSPWNLSPTCARKLAVPGLCRGCSDSFPGRRQPVIFGSLSPERHDAGLNFLTTHYNQMLDTKERRKRSFKKDGLIRFSFPSINT